jgi:hypothetical protein
MYVQMGFIYVHTQTFSFISFFFLRQSLTHYVAQAGSPPTSTSQVLGL